MIRSLALGAILFLAAAAAGQSRPAEEMRPLVDAFRAAPEGASYQASGISRVRSGKLLEALGATEAYWLVSDEGKCEETIRLTWRGANGVWQSAPAKHRGPVPVKTDDAEELAHWNGAVYIIGSHSAKKNGEPEIERHFFASFREDAVTVSGTGPLIEIGVNVRVLRLPEGATFQAVNDALKHSALIPAGEAETKAVNLARFAREGDRLLNIEGFDFLNDGSALVGLRFPVTADGTPLLLHMTGLVERFEDPAVQIRFEGPWTIRDAGTPERPRGIRALRHDERGRLHIGTGSLERSPGILLRDHPKAAGDGTGEHRVLAVAALGSAHNPEAVLWHNAGIPDAVEGIEVNTSGTVLYLSETLNEIVAERE